MKSHCSLPNLWHQLKIFQACLLLLIVCFFTLKYFAFSTLEQWKTTYAIFKIALLDFLFKEYKHHHSSRMDIRYNYRDIIIRYNLRHYWIDTLRDNELYQQMHCLSSCASWQQKSSVHWNASRIKVRFGNRNMWSSIKLIKDRMLLSYDFFYFRSWCFS